MSWLGLGKDAGVCGLGHPGGWGAIHGCHMQPSASAQEDPSFLNLSYLSPSTFPSSPRLWLTRFHILNHYFNFSCLLRRIVVTSLPALHICPSTHLRLTRARQNEVRASRPSAPTAGPSVTPPSLADRLPCLISPKSHAGNPHSARAICM